MSREIVVDNFMKLDEMGLEDSILEVCREEGWYNILYAGIVGSAVTTQRRTDIDVIVITSDTPKNPCIFHAGNKSLLVLNLSWLSYDIHLERPTGLVPSVLFKSIELSQPIIGSKDKINLPRIIACMADWINVEIKKKRYKKIDRKNYLVALIFDRLLRVSPDLSSYNFDNIEMARNVGIIEVAKELERIYGK